MWRKTKEMEQQREQFQKQVSDMAKALRDLQLESMNTIGNLQTQISVINTRLATIQAMCGNTSIEDKVASATNYEFGLQVMKKQLMDQLVYVGGGDESLVTTIRFESIEALCTNMITMINVLIQTNNKS